MYFIAGVKYLRKFLVLALFASMVIGARGQQSNRLINNWEFIRQDLGSVWEAVRPVPRGGPESVPVWTPVALPHCVNARDGVDPDGNYYQGPAWYRTALAIHQPYQNGRTLLHFEGAGQATDVYVYTTKVGSHVGGYDEWTVDITDAAAACLKDTALMRRIGGKVPVSVRTDNSRNVERIPSAMSDFSVYGGLYRYVNLVYAPPVSVAGLLADPRIEGKDGKVDVRALLYRPTGERAAELSATLTNANGTLLSSISMNSQDGHATALDTLTFTLPIKAPQRWSPDHPTLYKLIVRVKDTHGQECVDSTTIGFRTCEFVDHGPFLLNGSRLLDPRDKPARGCRG